MIELDSGVFMQHIEELVDRKRWPELREILRLLEPADIALILTELPLDRLPLLYRLLPKALAAEVFVEMEADAQGILISSFSDAELREVLSELYNDFKMYARTQGALQPLQQRGVAVEIVTEILAGFFGVYKTQRNASAHLFIEQSKEWQRLAAPLHIKIF